MAIADKLKIKRKQLRLTQPEMADILGVDTTKYSRWETGEVKPSLGAITNISQKLKVSYDFLLGDVDMEEPVSKVGKSRYLKKTVNGYVCAAEFCEWRKDGFCPGTGCMKEASRPRG